MAAISVIYDRLRLEEKTLKEAGEKLGHTMMMADAKSAQAGTDHPGRPEYGDVALERCISYFRGLHFTAYLEHLGVPVVNSLDVAGTCGNKLLMSLALKRGRVPTPKTSFAFSKDAAEALFESSPDPLVIKPVIGSWGRGVMRLKDRDTLDAIIESREITDGPYDRIYYLQKEVKRPPRDIRAITVGGQVIAAMYRKSEGFKSNVARGAEPERCEPTGQMREAAAAASEAVGGGILGIDMMEDKEAGLVVHEVNNTVEFKGLASVAEKSIPEAIIEYAAEQAKR